MITHKDIVDYVEIDRINGNTNTRSRAALALYRFITNLLREMGWPSSDRKFGTFEGGGDSSDSTLTLAIGERTFSIRLGLSYVATREDIGGEKETWD